MAINQNANLLTKDIITKETIAQYEGNAQLSLLGDWKYSSLFANEVDQVGDSIRIRRPVLTNILEDDMNWVGNKPYETQITLKLDKSFLTPLYFSDADLTLRIENFSDRFISEAVSQLAIKIDKYFYEKVINSSHWTVGQYNTPITSDTIRAARELLDASSMPRNDDVYGILTPKHTRSLAGEQASLFHSDKAISNIYLNGRIGKFHGIEFGESNSSPTHFDGGAWSAVGVPTLTASPALTSGWAETKTISVNGFTAGTTVNAGDVFVLSAATTGPVYNYNPYTGGRTPYVQQFVVRESVASTTSAGQALLISPCPITSGEYQNVDNVGTSAVLVKYSTSGATYGQEGLIFHKSAIAFASPKLTMAKGTDKMEQVSGDVTDIRIRYSRDWNSITNVYVTRLDCIVGVAIPRPEWIARIR